MRYTRVTHRTNLGSTIDLQVRSSVVFRLFIYVLRKNYVWTFTEMTFWFVKVLALSLSHAFVKGSAQHLNP